MASCHVVRAPGMPVPMCMVHGKPLQPGTKTCPDQGQPAVTTPVHVYTQPDGERAVSLARHVTAGSRPIVVHNGSETDPAHLTEAGDHGCWCEPVTIPSG